MIKTLPFQVLLTLDQASSSLTLMPSLELPDAISSAPTTLKILMDILLLECHFLRLDLPLNVLSGMLVIHSIYLNSEQEKIKPKREIYNIY